MKQLYPKKPRDLSHRRWYVDYDLAYDGGGSGYWRGYYANKLFALVATWWNVHISSWGGSAILYDQKENIGSIIK